MICFGQLSLISGFTGTSQAYITDRNGGYIPIPDKSYKQIIHNANWQYEVQPKLSLEAGDLCSRELKLYPKNVAWVPEVA